jgi:ferredoxin--NADP+ reductase
MFNATLTKKIMITPELMRIVVTPDEAPKPFLSGQYVAIGLPSAAKRPEGAPAEPEPPKADSWIKRAYSIASSPNEAGILEFYIAILPTGALTSRLTVLNEGDRLFCAGKITGTFTLDPAHTSKRLLFMSTGTGLAPFISMLRSGALETDVESIILLHGVRYPSDLGYRDEVENFSQRYPGKLQYIPVVSRGGDAWKGFKGHVQHVFAQGVVVPDPTTDRVFMCGNPAMIEEVEGSLVAKGFVVHSKKTPGNLHVEKYW